MFLVSVLFVSVCNFDVSWLWILIQLLAYCMFFFFFFFSSRRRHTRCSRDWSSDVCSSDLPGFMSASVFGLITCHTPLTSETTHMINPKTLALMKPGAIFVNTSRGPVQDERALFEALTRGHPGAAGLDVWEEEPTPLDNPLLNLENVVCSPHVAGVTREANRQMAVQVAGEMLRVLRGEKPEVLVNPEVWPRLGQR